MASFIFNAALLAIANQSLDFVNDDIRVLLLKGAGTPVKGNANITAALAETDVDECDATDYVRKALAGMAISLSSDKILFDATNPVWTTLGGASNNTVTGAIVFKQVTNDGDSIPIAYLDTNDLPTNGGQVTLTKDATNKFFYLNNA